MGTLEQVLWWVNLGALLVLVVKLGATRLHRVYKSFFAFVAFQVLQSVVMMPLDPAKDEYAWAYIVTQPVLWVLYVFVVLELYGLALRNHPGISSLSRWVLFAALFVSVTIAAMSLSADLSSQAGPFPLLVYMGVIERGLTFSLVLFLLMITAFLIWTPVPLPRNVVVHAALYSAYFLSTAAALLVRNVLGYHLVGGVSVAVLASYNVCLLLWILLLGRKGEETPIVVRRFWRNSDEDIITRQLDAVNAFLLKSAGKQNR